MKTSNFLRSVFFNLMLFFTSSIFLAGQSICLPTPGGVRPGDEPPGCTICTYNMYTGSTGGNTPEQTPLNAPCSVENSQWLNFTSSANQLFGAKIQAYSCSKGKGIEAVLFDKDFIPVSDCFKDKPGNGASYMEVSGIKPFETYHLMIDGIDGDICGLRLEPVTGLYLPEPYISEIEVSGVLPDDLCPGTQRIYSVFTPTKPVFYKWGAIPRMGELIAGGGILDSFMIVEYKEIGSSVISVTPLSVCADTLEGTTRTHNVRVTNVLSARTETVEFCVEELPLTYKGIYIDEFQTIESDIFSEDSCIYRVTLQVLEKKEIVTKLDTFICPGDCVVFEDSCYFQSTNTKIELYCKEIRSLNITHPDSSSFELNCFPDPFLNALALDWKPIFGADSYQIFIDGNLFSEQQFTSFLYPVTNPGDSIKIKVVPKNKLGCDFYQAEISCVLPNSTSVISQNELESKMDVFPNPNRGRFYIKTDFIIEKTEVFDLSGNRISINQKSETSNPIEFEISDPTSGVYFLKIYSKGGIFVRKIILY